MARHFFIRIGFAGAVAAALWPVAGSANQFNVSPTMTPVRPQIHFSPSLRIDARSQAFDGIDLSEACRPDERLRKNKRERRCRQER